MGSSAKLGLEMFEVGPCEDAYTMGFLIGQRFSDMIKSRLASDLILHNQLLPFAQTPEFQPLLQCLTENNRNKFPGYWEELVGTADGSGVPILDIILINFRKEILPLLPKTTAMNQSIDTPDDCSDVLVVSDSMAVVAHNEDANVALVGHTYLIKGTLSNGISFIAYTYAGELPSCAFGLNTHGLFPHRKMRLLPEALGGTLFHETSLKHQASTTHYVELNHQKYLLDIVTI